MTDTLGTVPSTTPSTLHVRLDGTPLPAEEARALWLRFSTHMDQHQGDFDGFARSEGLFGARVSVDQGAPTLHLASTAAKAASKPAAGGGGRPGAGQGGRRRGGKRRRR